MPNSEYDNTNQGVLFKNKRKEKENHPDYRGEINVRGRTFWLSAWIKESKKDGSKFMSLSVQEKDGERESAPRKKQVVQDIEEDDTPF